MPHGGMGLQHEGAKAPLRLQHMKAYVYATALSAYCGCCVFVVWVMLDLLVPKCGLPAACVSIGMVGAMCAGGTPHDFLQAVPVATTIRSSVVGAGSLSSPSVSAPRLRRMCGPHARPLLPQWHGHCLRWCSRRWCGRFNSCALERTGRPSWKIGYSAWSRAT